MPVEIFRLIDIKPFVNIFESFACFESAAINLVVILAVDIQTVLFEVFAVGKAVFAQAVVIFQLKYRIHRLG